MLRHVLVPLDGSMLAEMALDHVKKLVGAKCRITLITVVSPPDYPIYDLYPAPTPVSRVYDAAMNDVLPHAKGYLERVADNLTDELSVEVTYEVETGDAATVIVDTAARLGVDAIVMSTHGRSGLGRWIFGSVTHKVLESASCPVLVVPGRLMQKKVANGAEQAAVAK